MRYVLDLDGTICTQEDDYRDARPLMSMIDRINELHASGNDITIFTARGTETGIDWRAVTEEQLFRWRVKYHRLLFGKPAGDVYVDDRAIGPSDWLNGKRPDWQRIAEAMG